MPVRSRDSRDIASLYRDARLRIAELTGRLRGEELAAPVPACPGWTVQDVVAHLVGVAEDAVAGRLRGPPSDAQTAEQVARYKGRPLAELLERWSQVARPFEQRIGTLAVRPPLIDVVSHEHDIRGALGRPGARDTDGVRLAAEALLQFHPPVPLLIVVDERELRVGPEGHATLILQTTRWDTLRWRMGRRSRRQLAAMEWSADPASVFDHLMVFGPAKQDVVE
jgi:uncharacterized protein (TIGR03083 family)